MKTNVWSQSHRAFDAFAVDVFCIYEAVVEKLFQCFVKAPTTLLQASSQSHYCSYYHHSCGEDSLTSHTCIKFAARPEDLPCLTILTDLACFFSILKNWDDVYI